jgi:RNA polymerase sigma factor (sigma-70 family)
MTTVWATVAPVADTRGDDRALAEAFRAGDQSALKTAYDNWGGMVQRYCARLLSSTADAEDVTQQVFVTAWDLRERYDPERAALSSWLMGIARNKVLDRRRANARLPTPMRSTPDAPSAVHDMDQVAQRLLVGDALERLPEDQRAALELAFFEGYSHGEVAERLGMPLGTAKSTIRRGLERLRRALPQEAA